MEYVKRLCPFSKNKTIRYSAAGHTPVEEKETFNYCVRDDCMCYYYDPHSDTEFCMLSWNPYREVLK